MEKTVGGMGQEMTVQDSGQRQHERRCGEMEGGDSGGETVTQDIKGEQ